MKKTSTRKKQRGQSLVEMAMFLMIILWLLAGAVDFGMAYFSFVQIRDAAQEGVIYGSIHPAATTDIIYRVRHSSDDPAHPAREPYPVNLWAETSVTVCPPNCDGSVPDIAPGNPISVKVVYDYHLNVPLLSTVIGTNTIPLTATATGVMLKTTP